MRLWYNLFKNAFISHGSTKCNFRSIEHWLLRLIIILNSRDKHIVQLGRLNCNCATRLISTISNLRRCVFKSDRIHHISLIKACQRYKLIDTIERWSRGIHAKRIDVDYLPRVRINRKRNLNRYGCSCGKVVGIINLEYIIENECFSVKDA